MQRKATKYSHFPAVWRELKYKVGLYGTVLPDFAEIRKQVNNVNWAVRWIAFQRLQWGAWLQSEISSWQFYISFEFQNSDYPGRCGLTSSGHLSRLLRTMRLQCMRSHPFSELRQHWCYYRRQKPNIFLRQLFNAQVTKIKEKKSLRQNSAN